MKRAIFAVVFALAAAGTAAAADNSLAGLIEAGNRDAALKMIAAGTDVNAAQGDGTTPLHWAVYKIDADLVRALLDHGAKADVINNYGSSPLAEAVKVANPQLVEMLLDAGSNVEEANQDGQTALMLAARAGSVEVADLLVRHGANVNAREKWRAQTALMWAADAHSAALTRFLNDHKADVNARAMAIDWPSQMTGEPRNQYRPVGGLTPLIYAARSGCTECVAALLDAGADVNRPSPEGVTPLMVAIDNFAFDTAKLLFERGANPNLWDWWGRTALYVAIDMNTYNLDAYAERTGPPIVTTKTTPLELARMFLDAGVNPNPQLNMHRPGRGGNSGRFVDEIITTGATPMLRAAAGQDSEAVKLLLKYGGRIDVPNVMGVTPLMAASGLGMRTPSPRFDPTSKDAQDRALATLEVLWAAGAGEKGGVNARMTDVTSLTARMGRGGTLPERGGQTALFGAVQWAWPRVAQWLLDHGADVAVTDDRHVSPLDAATGKAGSADNHPSAEVAKVIQTALGQ
ncbi:MAG TPA: ankyrin repeat domain-containing protein [Xanthobacteraceae bacterium]|nr:ankyrin repeat domain-containing protein [Xanthobacteraceae bacterium]